MLRCDRCDGGSDAKKMRVSIIIPGEAVRGEAVRNMKHIQTRDLCLSCRKSLWDCILNFLAPAKS